MPFYRRKVFHFTGSFLYIAIVVLGSPLKTNAISALAYSPSQRNAFRFQQQHIQQQYLQHQQLQQPLQQQQQQHQILPPSPMLQGFSSTPSPHLQSPHMEQLLMVRSHTQMFDEIFTK